MTKSQHFGTSVYLETTFTELYCTASPLRSVACLKRSSEATIALISLIPNLSARISGGVEKEREI